MGRSKGQGAARPAGAKAAPVECGIARQTMAAAEAAGVDAPGRAGATPTWPTSLPPRQPSTALPHLVVFGGSGFIGARVCQAALAAGLGVVSVSRSGRPAAAANAPWAADVDWLAADVFEEPAWRSALDGAVGVVSTLGAFGSNAHMERVCGDANISIFDAAAAAGVPRASFISVHEYGLPDAVLRGYFHGKRRAEAALARAFPGAGVALRPGFVYGTRSVGGFSLPLGLVGA